MSSKRDRGSRRAASRSAEKDAAKLRRDAERLFTLEPGGSPERPIVIGSPAQVEITAAERRCPLHDAPMRVVDHVAATVAGSRLRVAHVRCPQCDEPYAVRRVFFQLAAERLN